MFPDLWIGVVSIAGELRNTNAALRVLLIELHEHGRRFLHAMVGLWFNAA